MSIYLDHCATTLLDPAVRVAMEQAVAEFGNPSSVHSFGRRARAALEAARRRLGELLHASPQGFTFTASGSEAANLAIKGVVFARAARPTHLVISAIEHDCVRQAARWLAGRFDWVELSEVNPGPDGVVGLEAIERALRPETALVAVMLANNETGMLQPVREIADLAHRHGALIYTDSVQALGRVPVEVDGLGCDLLSLSAHKFYGPRGVGLLWTRPGVTLEPLIHGGHQEALRRAGTENLPGVIGMEKAAETVLGSLDTINEHLRRLESLFREELQMAVWPADGSEPLVLEQNGRLSDKIPGVLNIAVRSGRTGAFVAQDDLVVGLDLEGVAISAGAACSSGVIEPSPVLRAMGLPDWRVRGGVRISFGRENTEAEAREAARKLVALCHRLLTPAPPEEVER